MHVCVVTHYVPFMCILLAFIEGNALQWKKFTTRCAFNSSYSDAEALSIACDSLQLKSHAQNKYHMHRRSMCLMCDCKGLLGSMICVFSHAHMVWRARPKLSSYHVHVHARMMDWTAMPKSSANHVHVHVHIHIQVCTDRLNCSGFLASYFL